MAAAATGGEAERRAAGRSGGSEVVRRRGGKRRERGRASLAAAAVFLARAPLGSVGSTEVKSRHQTQPTPQTNLSPTPGRLASSLFLLPSLSIYTAFPLSRSLVLLLYSAPQPRVRVCARASTHRHHSLSLSLAVYARSRLYIRIYIWGIASRRFLTHARRICVWLANFRARYRKVRSHRLPARLPARPRSLCFERDLRPFARWAGGGRGWERIWERESHRKCALPLLLLACAWCGGSFAPRKNIGRIKRRLQITGLSFSSRDFSGFID